MRGRFTARRIPCDTAGISISFTTVRLSWLLLSRKGKIHQRDLERLQFAEPLVLDELQLQWKRSLDEADRFIRSRPPGEAGRLYLSEKGFFFAPQPGDSYQLHAPEPGGVMPRLGSSSESLFESPELREQLEQFFGRPLGDRE